MSEVSVKKDWTDYLSPVLIKEFRQGLRSQVFLWAFMLIHVFMAWGLLTNLSVGSSVRGRQFASAFFWIITAIPLLPFGAMGSISQERRDGTLDLIQLAHQNTFKLILGKWMASAGLTLLLVMAIMPYLVLRYYLGSIDVVSDMRDLSIVLLASFLLGGVAITCSSTAVHVMRQWLAFLIMGGVLLSGMTTFLFYFQHAFSQGQDNILFIFFYFVLVCAYALYMALKWATTQIAPVSENHSYALRWAHVLFLCINLLVFWWVEENELRGVVMGLCAVMSITIHLRVLCESDARYVGELYPFRKKRLWDRLQLAFFAPGHHSGYLYMLMVWSIFGIMLLSLTGNPSDIPGQLSVLISLYMGLTFPFYMGEKFTFRINNHLIRGLLWLGILLLPIVFYGVGNALKQPWTDLFEQVSKCIPVSSFFYTLSKGNWGRLDQMSLLYIFHTILFIPILMTTIRCLKKSYVLLGKIKPEKEHVQEG